MRRRALLRGSLALSFAATAWASHAQATRRARLGFLSGGQQGFGEITIDILSTALAELGPRAGARYLTHALEASLRRLGTDRVDLFQLHTPSDVVPFEETLDALDALVRAGKVRAVLFGYACHCTTLGGEFNKICAEWAGYACDDIERQSPGAVAIAIIGCGADANPEPRRNLDDAKQQEGTSKLDSLKASFNQKKAEGERKKAKAEENARPSPSSLHSFRSLPSTDSHCHSCANSQRSLLTHPRAGSKARQVVRPRLDGRENRFSPRRCRQDRTQGVGVRELHPRWSWTRYSIVVQQPRRV